MAESSVSKFFDSYAREFDAIYGTRNNQFNRLVNRVLRRSMKLRFDRSMAACRPLAGKTALDIGCGPGHYAVKLAEDGAQSVLGVDFAEEMIALSRQRAQQAGVADRCGFEVADFRQFPTTQQFDYTVVMGFMDYVADPSDVIAKVLSLTREKAVFSFPVSGGVLAWQRKLRYRSRCELYLYRHDQVKQLFATAGAEDIRIERIARDFFVSARPCRQNRPTDPGAEHEPRRHADRQCAVV